MDIYTRLLICLAAIVVLAASSCAAPTPFVIGGWIFYENGTDCDDPAVNITNTDTGMKWQAVTAAGSNYYQIVRVNGTDLNESEQLQFSAKSPDGSQSNTTEHDVAQGEVGAGGIFDFNITLGPMSGDVDLNVTDIEVNPNCSSTGDAIFVNQSNEICATVYNAGPGDVTGNFDVCFYDDANTPPSYIGSTTVTGGLTAGANTAVRINWTPSCVDYPGLSGDYLAIRVLTTLNVTVDCNDAVNETDETNNTLLMDTEVSANGYKSKNFDCSGDDPLTPFKYAGDLFTGGLAYNVSGTKQVLDPSDTQTRVHHIELPSGATVEDARLYVTYYDDFGNPSPGCLANLSVNLTGPCGSETFTTPDAMYTDQKAYGTSYNLPKGKYAYNITSLVCGTSNDYSVTVENIDPTNTTVLLGGILVVVYEGGDETIQLWWQEGCDLLSGRTKYRSSTTEATATIAFPGSINLTTVGTAELITVVDQGMETGSNLLFNGNVIKTDAWNAPSEAYPGSMINVENVTVSVSASRNTMGFQDTGTMGMQADLAFFVVTLGVSGDVDLNVTDIEVNPNCSSTGDAIFVNQSNEMCATVYNAGPGDVTGNFDVCFYDDANTPPSYIGSTTVTGGLTA
ncbi:MAG: DUF3344 domain-containing protein, partial [Euryarchaeota archaeon]|nr:DUF3344 domain-containing protein [Euryarchaeota archaeon]